jgi:hypothetical protein
MKSAETATHEVDSQSLSNLVGEMPEGNAKLDSGRTD